MFCCCSLSLRSEQQKRKSEDMKVEMTWRKKKKKKLEWITIYILNDSKNKRIILYDNMMRVWDGREREVWQIVCCWCLSWWKVGMEINRTDTSNIHSVDWRHLVLFMPIFVPSHDDLKKETKKSRQRWFWTRTIYGDFGRKWKTIQYMTNLWGMCLPSKCRFDIQPTCWRCTTLPKAYFTDT